MSTLKVDGIRSNSASSDAITLASNGTCTANITNTLGHKNIIINGDCRISQRGTSSASSGYQTVDRFKHSGSGWDSALTQAQGDVASGTTPYTQGFRKTFKLTNDNQSSGAGTNDSLSMSYVIEDQDLATSGWNYLSSTSYVTLSFWFKSSVNQTFYVILESKDGTSRQYSFAITPTGADTWTKVTHTIPGNSGLQFSNDNGEGIEIYFALFYGTNLSTSDHTLNTWKTTSSTNQIPDMTSTWFTTNNATFEITGVQLEVGSVATDFEHKSYAQELALCQRYYYLHASGQNQVIGVGVLYQGSNMFTMVKLPVTMRTAPTIDSTTGSNYYQAYNDGSNDGFTAFSGSWNVSPTQVAMNTHSGDGFSLGSGGECCMVKTHSDSGASSAHLGFSAEL